MFITTARLKDDEQVLEFQVQESDLRREIPGNSVTVRAMVFYPREFASP
jgi:hypothetical protein